jgi:hypothetical protein
MTTGQGLSEAQVTAAGADPRASCGGPKSETSPQPSTDPPKSPRPVVVSCSFNTFPHGEPVLTVPLNDDEELPDTEFPLGDGTAETAATVYCPYCNESVEIAIDPGGGSAQEYVEDCEVCCQPWSVSVQYSEDGTAKVSIEPLDE